MFWEGVHEVSVTAEQLICSVIYDIYKKEGINHKTYSRASSLYSTTLYDKQTKQSGSDTFQSLWAWDKFSSNLKNIKS